MAYETAITINEAIDKIKDRRYMLPSIQREFVWKVEQIEALFDSLMRGYPIGTFLFWEVKKSKIKDFQFYEFLKKYHVKTHRHNQKAGLSSNEDITAILDGQQRMTSLYLALSGSYTSKQPYGRRNNPDAYLEHKLYLNLLKPSTEVEAGYDFQFLTEEEAESKNSESCWFECSKILSFAEKNEIFDYLDDNNLSDTSVYSKETSKFARNTLNRFYDVIYTDCTISFYLEKSEELDKVLQIFIRINSGGTKLSYSDLLLSIATAQWQEKDAREVIHEFVDAINNIGDGFDFNKDLVLKNCLVLADFTNIKFRVDNFNKENMKTIETEWEKTSSSLRVAIELVKIFGYNGKNLIATNAIIPIAYFIFKNECSEYILHSSKWEDSRNRIKEWLARVLLKGIFGGKPDSIYPRMRDLINQNLGRFPLKETIDSYKGIRNTISFGDDEISNLLELEYGKAKTYCALTLIYPALDHSFKYHQDHIHPRSKFDKNSMTVAGMSKEQIDDYMAKADNIANLQLLQATTNIEKSRKPFKEWLNNTHPGTLERNRYLEQHHINPSQSLDFEDFIDFVNERRKNIKKLLISILGATPEENDDE